MKIIEPIGHEWKDELVWLDLPEGGGAARVVDASGRVWPSQVCAIDPRRAGAEKPRICARIDLAADSELDLRVERVPAKAEASPFRIDEGAEAVTIDNGRIAVRSPASAPFDPGWAPGPILAVKRQADSDWTGRGEWGPTPFLGRVETIILDRGPLFARWLVRYIIGGMEIASYDMRLTAGEDFIHVRDTTPLGEGKFFRFHLAGADAPQYWCTHGGGEVAKASRRSISEPPDRQGSRRPEEFLHIDFNSGHQQMSLSWGGLYGENGPVIGVCEFNGGHWLIAGVNRISATRNGDAFAWEFPVNGGSKQFAFVVGEPDAYAPELGLSRFTHIRRKYSDIPLEKVRHWVTRFEPTKYDRPITYPKGTVEKYAEKLKAWPALAGKLKALVPVTTQKGFHYFGAWLPIYLASGDPGVRQVMIDSIEKNLATTLDHILNNGYIRLIIFSGRWQKVILEIIDVLRWKGEISLEKQREYARKLTFISYAFADPNFWPCDSLFRPRYDQRGHGEVYRQSMGDIICPPNFTTEYFTSFGLTAMAYPEHPAAKEWTDLAVEMFERNLDTQFYESGGYSESANYHDHELQMLLQFATALQAAGVRDFFEHRRFKRNFSFFLDMLTPKAHLTEAGRGLAKEIVHLNPPTDDRATVVTNWGNSGNDCSGSPLPQSLVVAAGIYADRDPAFACRLMSAWRSSPQRFAAHYAGLNTLALGRPDLKDIDLSLGSRIVEGLGAVMRTNIGRADEVFAWIKNGPATHHNCGDEGGMVLYAHGAPIIGDFGYWCTHEGNRSGCNETWKHACVTFGGKTNSMFQDVETALPPELWRSTPEADLLVTYAPVDLLLRPGQSYLNPDPIPRIDYRRFTLFVKPHYFVIYDHIPATTLPTTYWLHALAEAVDLSAQGARFRGRWGVDLHLQVLLPTPAKIEQGIYSVQRHVRIEQPGAGDYLTVLSALPASRKPPLAAYSSRDCVLTVTGEWGTDKVLISPTPVMATIDGNRVTGRVALVRNGKCIALDDRP